MFTLADSLACKEVIWGAGQHFQILSRGKGDIDSAWSRAAFIVEGEYETGAQEQLYIEPQGVIAKANPERRRHGLGLAAVPLLCPQSADGSFSACRKNRSASCRPKPAADSAARKNIRR